MYLRKPKIFEQFPNLIFGFSKKMNSETDTFHFNMSKSIGDSNDKVISNRNKFFGELGLTLENVIIQNQIHSDIINIVDSFQDNVTGDALITNKSNLGLAISTADCTNIYIYDSVNNIIAAVHSGWAGTEKKILLKTIKMLKNKFSSQPQNLYVYFGPSISQKNYEVGREFLDKFDEKYFNENDAKIYLDLKRANFDMLIGENILPNNIEVSTICSFEDDNYHSYRRDKNNSGRALGIISLKGKIE